MIKNYFRIAVRNFWRHKLFTFINVIGLSIGVSAALVIFLIVHHDFTFDKSHENGDRIYRVVTDYNYSGNAFYNSGVTGPLPVAVKNEVAGVQLSVPVYIQSYNVLIPGGKEAKFRNEDDITYADQRYFNMFTYKWIEGSGAVLNQPNQVVLSSGQAKIYFPGLSFNDIMGKEVIYDDSIKTNVGGIVEMPTANTDLTFHDFISYSTIQTVKQLKQQQSRWGGTNGSSQFFIELAANVKPGYIEKQLRQLLLKYEPEQAKNGGYRSRLRLQPLSDIHFNENYGAINSPAVNKATLYGLIAVAAFLLTLGCINFINLTTAQSAYRAREIGIRKTMGSNRLQLIGQFLSETFLITLLAVIISIVLIPVILSLFSGFISKDINFGQLSSPVVILFILLLTTSVSLIAGFYPALVLSGYKPVAVLKNQAAGGAGTRNAVLRKSLTITQFVIAQFFIMATLLVSRQIYYALNKDLGFKKSAIVYIDLPWKQKSAGFKQVFINKVKALPQVGLISLGGDVPSSAGWSSNDVTYRDGKKEIKTELYHKSGDENYIRVYQIRLLAGRNIRESDTASAMLVNSTFAHLLGFSNSAEAIGKTIEFGKTERRQIVGIIGDFHQASLKVAIKPLAIYPEKYEYESTLHIALKPQTTAGGQWSTAIAAMRDIWKQIYPDDEFECSFFDESIAKMYQKEQHTSVLLTWATGLAILISCLGLLGLAIYSTNQRTKEIGVRKVLGASVAQIVGLLSREMILLILLAFVIVTPVAWYAMNKWLQTFADHTVINWWIFVLSGAGMVVIALFTSSFQTIKAAIANPVKSLRSE